MSQNRIGQSPIEGSDIREGMKDDKIKATKTKRTPIVTEIVKNLTAYLIVPSSFS